jgi:5-methylcytosine-specific restriction endonuclease McrA
MLSFAKRTSDAIHYHRERARAAGTQLDYDLTDLRRIVRSALDDGQCAYCKGPITERDFGLDHAEPVCRTGRFDLANLIVCCMTCNAAKGPLTESEFRDLLKLLSTWPISAQVNTLARLRAGARAARWSVRKMANGDK